MDTNKNRRVAASVAGAAALEAAGASVPVVITVGPSSTSAPRVVTFNPGGVTDTITLATASAPSCS